MAKGNSQILKQATWSIGLEKRNFEPLNADIEADVAIVGGGMAGVLSAYVLGQTGKKIVLLEKTRVGSGVTALTTAFLTQSIDTDLTELINIFGTRGVKMLTDSHGEAIQLIKHIAEECHIPCEFTDCSNYIYARSKKDLQFLEEEYKAAQKIGLPVQFDTDGSKIKFKNKGFLELKNQAKFHPLKFLYGLLEKFPELGVAVYENTEVKKLESNDDMVHVETARGTVHAKKVIVTTYEPFNKPFSLYFRKGMYVSYVFDMEVEGLSLVPGIYEDMDNPYHYLRVDALDESRDIQRVILGGEDHRKMIPVNSAKSFNALQSYADDIFKDASSYTIKAKWTGPVLEPADGLALIGPLEKDIFYGTVFSGNGMTYSGIAALMARDFVLGKSNVWADYYEAARVPSLASLATKFKDYSMELVKGAVKNTFTENKKPITRMRIGKKGT